MDGNQFTPHTAEEAAGALESAARLISDFTAAMAPILGDLGRIAYGVSDGVRDASALRQGIEEHIRENYPDCFRAVAERWEEDPLRSAA